LRVKRLEYRKKTPTVFFPVADIPDVPHEPGLTSGPLYDARRLLWTKT
jgi:hypothetical protein